jgi:hypothetical protein
VTQIKADQTQNLAYDNWYAIWLINFSNIYLLQELPRHYELTALNLELGCIWS